jgi:sugar (pentulose or hexulose) kinase
MTSDEYILAIDCGSTNMKASVFNRELVSLGGASAPVEYSIQDGTHFEMPVESINDSFIGLCHAAAHDAGIGEGQIGALALGSQAQTFAVLDRHGRAKTPFISWMDKRATAEAEELQNLFGAAMHRHCSFPQHMPQLQLAKLLWVQRHTQAGIAETDRVVSLPTFMAMSVGGKHKTDRNLAAMGGAYSLQLGTWWAQVLAHCGIDIDVMGELVDVGTAVSCTPPPGAGKLFANPLRIVYAGNDQTVGAYGNGCGERDMVVTLGTALVVYRFAGLEPGPFHKNGCWGPFPGHGYYELATRDEGCMALDWAMENMLGKRLPRDFDAHQQPGKGAFCRKTSFLSPKRCTPITPGPHRPTAFTRRTPYWRELPFL